MTPQRSVSVLTLEAARMNLHRLVGPADQMRRTISTIDGGPAAVLMSFRELEGLEETREIMSDPQL
jgi:hypothetical protein